jgi:glutamine amidotransferase
MGWNQVRKSETRNPKSEKECPLLKDIPDDSFVYFCHSYYPEPKDWSVTAATCDYGLDFTCAVWKENVYGVQFHPEKSQKIGLKMLENFVKLC